MTRVFRYWLFLLVIVSAVLIADQLTKRLIVDSLAIGETRQPIPALVPYFQITHSFNTGAAFGLFADGGNLFLVLAVLIVGAMMFFYPRLEGNVWATRFAIGLICGGALGNALDRVQYGHVVDFIHYQIPGVISNVSNIADHAIVLGVIVLLIDSWRTERQKPETPSTTEA